MSYVNTANQPNPAAILGAFGVPGGIAVLLVTGLAITASIPEADTPFGTFDVREVTEVEPIPDTETPPIVDTSAEAVSQNPDPAPVPTRPDTPFTFNGVAGGEIAEPFELDSGLGVDIEPIDFGPPSLPFDPIAAAPLGNPGGWIRDSDYLTSWINRDYSGVAAFSLEIDARGKVSDCSITRSTGHAALDEATCRLLQRRAQFEPAKDGNGNAVAGMFSSSVNWKIPE